MWFYKKWITTQHSKDFFFGEGQQSYSQGRWPCGVLHPSPWLNLEQSTSVRTHSNYLSRYLGSGANAERPNGQSGFWLPFCMLLLALVPKGVRTKMLTSSFFSGTMSKNRANYYKDRSPLDPSSISHPEKKKKKMRFYSDPSSSCPLH